MPRLPFFGFPYLYPYNTNYHRNFSHNLDKKVSLDSDNIINESTNENYNNRSNNTAKHRQPLTFNFDGFSDNSKPVVELLGINLYIDDIIILCLLFILYKEEVKDEMLFICLLLLLIS